MSEMNNVKQQYEGIEIPDELDLVIEKAISRGRKKKRLKFVKPAVAIAGLAAAFVLMVNVSPAFAYYMKDVPGIAYIVEMVSFDKGLRLAAQNGFVQEIGKSAESNGIKFTVDNAILDRKRLIIAYTVESEGRYTGLVPREVKIMGKNGEPVDLVRASYPAPDNSHFRNDGKCSGLFDITFGGEEEAAMPETIALSVGSFSEQPLSGTDIQGNWRVEFNLDKSLMDIEPKTISINRKISVEGMKFNMDYMKVYPTVVELKLRADKDNKYRFTGFKNLYLEDEKGNKYKYTGGTIPGAGTYSYAAGTISQTETILNFESSYFIDAKELYLVGEGVYTMPLENKYLVVDLENKKVLDDGGYGIEYLYDRRDEMWGNIRYDLILAFDIKNKGIFRDDYEFGIDWNGAAFDENNNMYHISSRFIAYKNNKEIGFMFDNMNEVPRTLRFEILGTSQGIMKPFRIAIK